MFMYLEAFVAPLYDGGTRTRVCISVRTSLVVEGEDECLCISLSLPPW